MWKQNQIWHELQVEALPGIKHCSGVECSLPSQITRVYMEVHFGSKLKCQQVGSSAMLSITRKYVNICRYYILISTPEVMCTIKVWLEMEGAWE